MYSYEDRIRAVRLFIKVGKRTKATVRQLDYSPKNALKSWHREYERYHELHIIYWYQPAVRACGIPATASAAKSPAWPSVPIHRRRRVF